ncbi:MAG: hypothetical protein HXS48_10720 [Theionarchaea archaeon]|nr:hypothetical protein [Theionarchaea archaeon]
MLSDSKFCSNCGHNLT